MTEKSLNEREMSLVSLSNKQLQLFPAETES